MKIGVLGSGKIGATIAGRLSAAGHAVKLANSRGPETITDLAAGIGVTASTAQDAIAGVEVIILSVPFSSNAGLASLVGRTPASVIVIDTSNYQPLRDGKIAELDAGLPESVWFSRLLNRPVIKAWNAVLAGTLIGKGLPPNAFGRIALPVAGDDPAAKTTAMALVDETGFDGYDAGSLEESWRQQPGTPAYCTELSRDALRKALAAAVPGKAPSIRDHLNKRYLADGGLPGHDDMIAQNRAATA